MRLLKRYVLHPGMVCSKIDGGLHFIDAITLAGLHCVYMSECFVYDLRNPVFKFHQGELVHLYPREDGEYPVFRNMKETQ